MKEFTEIVVDKKSFPKVIIAGEEYDLLCQYIMVGKNQVEANVYFDHNLSVTIELKEQNVSSKAILDVFSLRDATDISRLIDFIDITLSPKHGITTYSCEDFPQYIISAMNEGGFYPTLCKDKMLSDELSQYTGIQPSLIKKVRELLSKKEKYKELQNDIVSHLASVIYMDAEKAAESIMQRRYLSLEEIHTNILRKNNDKKAVEKEFRQELNRSSLAHE